MRHAARFGLAAAFLSSFGQTFFIGLFGPALHAQFGLDARQWGLLYGAATRGLLYDLERFRGLGAATLTATDDGSEGFHGNVLELLAHEQEAGRLPREVRLLACGPEPMLLAVERLARARELPCWLSLETQMGCGVGICNGCPVPTRAEGPLGAWPNAKCCVEGPVFPIDAITLETGG